MLEGLGGVAGAIVAGSKIASGAGNAIHSIKRMATGLKKYNKKQNPQPHFKKKVASPSQPNIK